MDPNDAVLFERLIWVNAFLRYFDAEPADAVLGALGTAQPALIEARARMHAAMLQAAERGDLDLSNRRGAEVVRATMAIAERKPTLAEVRRLVASRSKDECLLPDVLLPRVQS